MQSSQTGNAASRNDSDSDLFIFLIYNSLGKKTGHDWSRSFSCSVPGMAYILLVKVQPRVFVTKCSDPQPESREAGGEEAV